VDGYVAGKLLCGERGIKKIVSDAKSRMTRGKPESALHEKSHGIHVT
jgi:hypothetical protein